MTYTPYHQRVEVVRARRVAAVLERLQANIEVLINDALLAGIEPSMLNRLLADMSDLDLRARRNELLSTRGRETCSKVRQRKRTSATRLSACGEFDNLSKIFDEH